MNSTDEVFVLTGCASGIGRRLAAELVARGKKVLITDLNLKTLEKFARELKKNPGYHPERLLHMKLDVTKPADYERAIRKAVKTWGGVDVMMNVAGYLLPGYVHEIAPAEVHRHLDINAKGVIFGTQAAARAMLPAGRGHIVNIASLAGVAPIPGLALYSASKFAVRSFSLAAYMELAPRGVKVTVVCPDAVQTPMLDLQTKYEEAALTFSGGKFLQTDDIVRVIFDTVLPKKPREIHIPRYRGWLARLGNDFPALADWLGSSLRRKGRKRQQQIRGES